MKRRRLWRVELAVEKSRCGDDGRWGVLGLWLEVDTEQESSLWMLCSLGPMQKLFEFHSPDGLGGRSWEQAYSQQAETHCANKLAKEDRRT